jgi:hypothetical protein
MIEKREYNHPDFPNHTFIIEEYPNKIVIDGVEFTYDVLTQLLGGYQWTLKDLDIRVLLSMALHQNKM